jgi:hypothetical protein
MDTVYVAREKHTACTLYPPPVPSTSDERGQAQSVAGPRVVGAEGYSEQGRRQCSFAPRITSRFIKPSSVCAYKLSLRWIAQCVLTYVPSCFGPTPPILHVHHSGSTSDTVHCQSLKGESPAKIGFL